jgi:hypothetical protein
MWQAEKPAQLVDMEDRQAPFTQHSDRDRPELQSLPLAASVGVHVDVAVEAGYLVERKELLRSGRGRSTDTGVQAELLELSHGPSRFLLAVVRVRLCVEDTPGRRLRKTLVFSHCSAPRNTRLNIGNCCRKSAGL